MLTTHSGLFTNTLQLKSTSKQVIAVLSINKKMCTWSLKGVEVPLTEEQLKGLLKRYDKNGDGRLSREELREVFRSLGLNFSGWRAWRALRHADRNGDGYISEEEMKELVKYATSKWGFSVY
ncbi:hypothetical protein Vadar_001253 [Vaccinium darrowii]|uniref:Uncharacterized protein n=1 Tax=Vaccinium darrowii TaxID=229202 RepID=A0ACB7Y494_9ERIC|nr:hypothetical protein Vadar_001253 [Vaccinium darrowii]